MPPEKRREERLDNTRDMRVEARVLPTLARILEGNTRASAIKAYRLANGGLKGMTDALVWHLMLIMRASASKPQTLLSLGRKETAKLEALRKARLKRASNLAKIHNNNSFLGGMTAPAISPEFAALNPEYMELVFRGDALYLPYAITSGATMGYSPGITSAVGNGFRTGWQTAGGYATRAGQALRTAGLATTLATGRAVRSPQFWATVGLMAEPAVAMADGVVEALGVQSGNGSAWPWLLGGVATGAGLIWGGNKLAKGRKAAATTAASDKPMFNWLWRRSPATEKRVAARGTYINTYLAGNIAEINKMKDLIMGGVDAHTEKFVKGKGSRATETLNPNFISDEELEMLLLGHDIVKNGKTISAKGIYGIRSLELPSKRNARITGNIMKVGGLAGGLGITGYGIYNAFSGNGSLPSVELLSNYDDIPDAMLEEGALIGVTLDGLITVIPPAEAALVTGQGNINIDSLDNASLLMQLYNAPIYGGGLSR